MRKRIQKLAQGKFEHVEPHLSISEDKIEVEVLEGQNYVGEFQIAVTNQALVKGIVYTSNPYMECLTPQFEGKEATIRFEFHSEGFIEGDIQKGEFYIICNRVEYNLSFVVSVSKLYAESSIGKIRTLHDFTKLSQVDYMEAFHIFSSAAFRNVLKNSETAEQLFYEGLGKAGTSLNNMEEFLISVKAKEPVRFKISDSDKHLSGITERQKEQLSVQKDGWGYLEFDVTSDAAFISLEYTHFTMDMFVGSVCEIPYYIDVEALHKGRNYGKIMFENAYQYMECTLTIEYGRTEEPRSKEYLEEQKTLAHVTQLYLDYRMKKIGAGLWAAQTIDGMNHLIAMHQEQVWYTLMKAQALIISGQMQESEWILSEYKRNADTEHKDAAYAYYLYLCTLVEREESYVNRLTKEIEEIYHKEQEDIRIFWILLFLKEDYCSSDTKKLRAIENKMLEGCHSPFLYIEAYYLYWQNPYLMTRLNEFETRVLCWAGRRGVLTSDLAMQITTLSSTKRVFSPMLFQTMCFAYERFLEEGMLTAILAYLIRGQRYQAKYHVWFERGIEEDLRIAGLNEAYLMSMDLQTVKKIPKMIQLYFQYNSTVPYKQKAALLANIIAHKNEEEDVYHNYRKIMEAFALAQVEEGHIDDNLAIIYAEMLDKGMIQKQMAKPLAKILFTHKMNCFSKKIVRMYVIHKQLKQMQSIPVINGIAYFQLYARDYVIVLEDQLGRRYSAGIAYQIERLMSPGQYYRASMEYAPCELAYLLYHFSVRDHSRMLVSEDKEYLRQFMTQDEIRDEYKAAIFPEVIKYFEHFGETENIEEYLKHAGLANMNREARVYTIEAMITYRLYELAYQYMREYGIEGIATTKMVALCTYEILDTEYESDDFLLALCEKVFLDNKYSEEILDYLSRYYLGPTKIMAKIWSAAQRFNVDTYGLEEKLLVQMLYTTELVDQVQEIYDSYEQHGAVRIITEAYLNYFAYCYFVRQGVVPAEVIEHIKQKYLEGQDMTEIMKLALLYASSQEAAPVNEVEREQIIEILLPEYLAKGMVFAFYKEYPEEVLYRFHLYDKQYIEYRTDPQKRVVLHFRMEESFTEEDMNEMYEGIFVKEVVLFFGAEMQYYIAEDDGEDTSVTESSSLSNRAICEKEYKSRYDMLNNMQMLLTLEDYHELTKLMRKYAGLNQINEEQYQIM